MKLNSTRFFLFLLLTVALLCGSLPGDNAAKTIDPYEIYQFCKTISAPRTQGRLAGTKDFDKVAEWAAGLMEKWGLQSIKGLDGYFQSHPSPYTIVDHAELEIFPESGGEEEKITLKPEKQFLPLLCSDNGEAKGKIVFAGWGICAPELKYNDFANLDIKGKYVLCFRGSPDRKNKKFKPYTNYEARVKAVTSRGGLGIFFIRRPIALPGKSFVKGGIAAIISETVADGLLKEKEITCKELKAKLKRFKKPFSFELEATARLKVVSRHFPDAVSSNVLAMIPGSDLQKGVLLIGAHLDHCGKHMGLIFPGAHDNASSCGVVLSIAGAMARMKTKPKQTVVFALFSGEEKGLVGSKYMAANLPEGMKNLKAMINFELTGIGDSVYCAVTSKEKKLRKAFQQAAEVIKPLQANFLEKARGNSDHQAFGDKGYTNVCITGGGPHMNYHGSGDTIYRVNPDIMGAVANFALAGILNIVN